MPDCDYCDAAFDEEQSYLEHLAESHWGELGAIDRRRVENEVEVSESLVSRRVALLGAGGLGLAALGAAGLLLSGDDGTRGPPPTPHDLQAVHYHGTLIVAVDDRRVDFSQDRYQNQAGFFHFERGDGRRWHVHARGVTIQRALATLDIGVTETTVTLGETTYDDADPNTTVTVAVNGDGVDPEYYVLQPDDDVRIVVQTGG